MTVDLKLMKEANGLYRTQSLFYEYRHQSPSTMTPIYTLKECNVEKDGVTYISAYKIFMESDTEYEAAYNLVGSWQHWEKLIKAKWFKNYLSKWQEEKEIKDKALARKALIQAAQEGNVSAAKIIHEGDKKRGRPSKDDIAKQAKIEAGVQEELGELANRFNDIKRDSIN